MIAMPAATTPAPRTPLLRTTTLTTTVAPDLIEPLTPAAATMVDRRSLTAPQTTSMSY